MEKYECRSSVCCDVSKMSSRGMFVIGTEGQQNMPEPNMSVGTEDVVQNTSLCYINYFELQALENNKCKERLSLNFLHLPKGRSLKKQLSCHKPPTQRASSTRKDGL